MNHTGFAVELCLPYQRVTISHEEISSYPLGYHKDSSDDQGFVEVVTL